MLEKEEIGDVEKNINNIIGILIDEQRALSLDIWPISTIASVKGYSCV